MKKKIIWFFLKYVLPLLIEFFREAIMEGLRNAFANWKNNRRKKQEQAKTAAETPEEKEKIEKDWEIEEERLNEMEATFIKSFQKAFQNGLIDFNEKLKLEEAKINKNETVDMN